MNTPKKVPNTKNVSPLFYHEQE